MARNSFSLKIRLETYFVNHLEKEKVNLLDPSFKQRIHKGEFKVMRLSISQGSKIFHLLFAQMMYLNIAAARSFLQITLLLLLWISQLATSASVEAVVGNL